MTAIAGPKRKLSRLSKAQLIEILQDLERQSQGSAALQVEHRQTKQALRDSGTLLRHATQMANLGYWIWDDIENRCIYCSDQLARMHGVSVEEYLAEFGADKAILGRIHPQDRARYRDTLARATRQKQPYALEFREYAPSGALRYLREEGEPVLDDEGRLVRTIGMLQDITETKRKDEARRETEKRFRDIAEESPVMLWQYDAAGRPVYFNKASLEFLGLTLEQARNRDIYAGIHPDHRETIKALDLDDLETRRPLQREYRRRRADGAYRWVLDVGAPRYGPGGAFEGYFGYCVDITAQREALEALRSSEARYRELFEDSPTSLWVEDWSRLKSMLDDWVRRGVADLRSYFREQPERLREAYDAIEITDISRESLRVFRAASKEALLAQWSSEQVDPNELAGFGVQVAALFYGAASYDHETCEAGCDGSKIFTRTRTVIPPRYRDSWSRVLVSMDDISDRKTAELELRERDARLRDLQRQLEQVSRSRAMGQLLRTLSCELNQPLTAIMNYSSAARRIVKRAGGADSLKVVGMMEKAIGQAMRASAVIRHLRDHIENAETRTTPQDVNQIVGDAMALALINQAQAGARYDLNLSEALPSALVNKAQIQHVAYHLIKNALEAMAACERRQLTIATSLDQNGAIEVAVGDSGHGIPPEVQKRLFEPFVTAKRGGLGLGLSISHSIIAAHGGRLWSAPNPGGGTRFHFTLPPADPGDGRRGA